MIRALIVDDEAPARERLRRMLSTADVDVVGEAEDGEQAIASIHALQPDLVFLDIQMPSLTGLEVAARLHAPRPRIVFCTAYDHFAVEAFELHAVDYLLKPVNRDRLARTVDKIGGEISEQRRRTREQDDAARTQKRLMPEGAPIEVGLDCAADCVPAGGIGGDYYDFLAMEDGRLGLVVADVSGKGMYAGLLAAALQARLQAITTRGSAGASDVVGELNRLTAGTIESNRFATVFFGIFDRRSSTFSYVNAGHPAAIVARPDGSIVTLDATSAAVGWTADARFEERSIVLAPNDVLVIYSDGISDAISPEGADLGVNGVVDILRRHLNHNSAEIIDAFREEVRRYTGGARPADDCTLLVARVKP